MPATSAPRVAELDDVPRLPAKDHILAVMTPTGYEPWPIPRVIVAVQERDASIQANTIRVALRRLHADEVLMRDSHKNYRLEPARQVEQGRISIAGLMSMLDT